MITSFSKLTSHDLATLANSLRSGRLVAPYSGSILSRSIAASLVVDVAADLARLADEKFTGHQIALLLETIQMDRKPNKQLEDLVDLVTTGPEAPGITNRDTSVVVQELFRQATQSVVIAGYAIYQGQQVFQTLSDRMEAIPTLDVRFYLNLQPSNLSEPPSLTVRKFAEQFKAKHWPQERRLPKVYFDPRSIDADPSKRASLHAKCIVVDSKEVFISSANFTERAQHRNIEVGLRVSSRTIGDQLCHHFSALVANGNLESVIE